MSLDSGDVDHVGEIVEREFVDALEVVLEKEGSRTKLPRLGRGALRLVTEKVVRSLDRAGYEIVRARR